MADALNLLLRVVRRRVDNGENLEDVLADYPKLTDAEREMVLCKIKPELQNFEQEDKENGRTVCFHNGQAGL